MRIVSPGTPPRPWGSPAWFQWVERTLLALAQATHDISPEQVADGFSFTNDSASRALDLSGATAEEVGNVLATLVNDLKSRGPKRR